MLNWQDWQTYLKLAAIGVAITAWFMTTQAKLEAHMEDTQDAVVLLMLICKNTSKTLEDQILCYNVIDRRK